MDIKSASEIVEQVKRDFEVYKDQVDELESICAAHEALSKRLSSELDVMRLLLKQVKHHAEDGNLERVRSLVSGIEL